jgi:hypothetical protein
LTEEIQMKMGEVFRRAEERPPAFGVRQVNHDDYGRYHIRGDVFFYLHAGKGSDKPEGTLELYQELLNLVVLDASILLARLAKNNVEPPNGIYCLAVGTGNVGWNPMSPPAATNTQRSLWSEIARKTFANTQFINAGGLPVAIPTNVVDFTTTFAEAEAVGPLDEMGLLGGNVSTNLSQRNPVLPPNGPYDPTVDLTQFDTLVNYLTFPVINKPATSTLTIVWRLSF